VSVDKTPFLKLNLPPFDGTPWDEDVNNNWSSLDGALAQFVSLPNYAGLWTVGVNYLAGQTVFDSVDSSQWLCIVPNTSVGPAMSNDRLAHPDWWTQTSPTPSYWASQAQAAANAAEASATAAAGSAAVAAGALPLSGGTMSGDIVLAHDPPNALNPATKQYVDARVGGVGFLPTTGGTMTGVIVLPGSPVNPLEAAPKQYADTKLPLTGATMTGSINFDNHANHGVVGTGTNDDANTGLVGEYRSNNLSSGSALSLTNNVAANVIGVSLTAGDWDVDGHLQIILSVGSGNIQSWIGTTASPVVPTDTGNGARTIYTSSSATSNWMGSCGPFRVSITTTTTVYLVAFSNFTSGTAAANGFIRARQVR
jgi:hypothetical protein